MKSRTCLWAVLILLVLNAFPGTSCGKNSGNGFAQVFSMDGFDVSQPANLPVSVRRIWHGPDTSQGPNYFIEVENAGSKPISLLMYMAGRPSCWKPSHSEELHGLAFGGTMVYWGDPAVLAIYESGLKRMGGTIEPGQAVVLTAPGETVRQMFREVPQDCRDPHVNFAFEAVVYADGSGWVKDERKKDPSEARPLERADKMPPFDVTTIEFTTGREKPVQIREWDLNCKDGLNVRVGFKNPQKERQGEGYSVMVKLESIWAPRNLYRNNLDMILKYNSWSNLAPGFPMRVEEVPSMGEGEETHALLKDLPVSRVLLEHLHVDDYLWCWAVQARIFVYDYDGRKVLETAKVLPIKRDEHFKKLRNVSQPDHYEPELP